MERRKKQLSNKLKHQELEIDQKENAPPSLSATVYPIVQEAHKGHRMLPVLKLGLVPPSVGRWTREWLHFVVFDLFFMCSVIF